jgi:hypothetical protein
MTLGQRAIVQDRWRKYATSHVDNSTEGGVGFLPPNLDLKSLLHPSNNNPDLTTHPLPKHQQADPALSPTLDPHPQHRSLTFAQTETMLLKDLQLSINDHNALKQQQRLLSALDRSKIISIETHHDAFPSISKSQGRLPPQ